jgi:predicted small secreted protein
VRIIYFVTHEVVMMNMFRRCVVMSMLIGFLLSLTGCNTIAGVGEDITGSARTVQHAF